MNVPFNDARKEVFERLRKERVTNLSINELCNTLRIDRLAFYRLYKNKANFIARCIRATIRKELKEHENRSLDQYFYYLILHIGREKTFYTNIIKIVNRNCICSILRENLNELIKNRVHIQNPIFETITNDFSKLIYSYLYCWVKHDCDIEVQTVWNELQYLLRFFKYYAKERREVDYLSCMYLINYVNKQVID